MIPGSANPLLLKQAAAGGYEIERSLRFNSSDSAYCGRTFTTPTTQGTFTFAAWIKRAALGTTQNLFGVSTNHSFGFTSGNALNLTFAGSSALTTTALFRDPSAWYHIVWTQSGTSHTLYVNTVSVGTATATSSVFNTAVAHQIGAANTANYFNGYLADIHFIDGQALTPSSFTEVSATTGQLIPKAYTGTYGTNGFHLDFSDNSAATATTLGADSSGNGNNWTPNNLSIGPGGNTSQNWSATASIAGQAGFEATKAFDGDASSASSTYYFLGTNGIGTFTFAQSVPYSTIKIWYGRNNGRLFVNGVDMAVSSTTYAEIDQAYLASKGVTSPLVSIGLERVSAGNGAYLFGVQVNGSQLIDPVYNAGNDSLVDTPTSYGEDTGAGGEVRGNYCTLNPLNLKANGSLANGNLDWSASATYGHAVGTVGVSSGKWYCEFTVSAIGSGIGVGVTSPQTEANFLEGNTLGVGYYSSNGNVYYSGGNAAYGTTFTTGNVIGVALDLDNGKVFFSKNGTWQNSGNPATGTNPARTGLSGTYTFGVNVITGSASGVFNFGQRPFTYAAPSGFKALCDTNLPEGTITTSGTFTGNANADGPFVWLNGVPTAMSINGNAVTFGTHADKLANGFKLRTNSTSYNTSGSNTYSITSTGAKFKYARAQSNP